MSERLFAEEPLLENCDERVEEDHTQGQQDELRRDEPPPHRRRGRAAGGVVGSRYLELDTWEPKGEATATHNPTTPDGGLPF